MTFTGNSNVTLDNNVAYHGGTVNYWPSSSITFAFEDNSSVMFNKNKDWFRGAV